jgi:hypothetical protein
MSLAWHCLSHRRHGGARENPGLRQRAATILNEMGPRIPAFLPVLKNAIHDEASLLLMHQGMPMYPVSPQRSHEE